MSIRQGRSSHRPIVAICYDFDKTLTPDNMQAQGFIQKVGYDPEAFWQESNALAAAHGMDLNLAWMYEMKVKAEGKTLFTRSALREYGARIQLFPGVKAWFGRVNEYGKEAGIQVEHYIISSGLLDMIEGSAIGDQFSRIYASSFLYDENEVAVWPAQAVNYTNKTQYLFRIEKGTLDVNDLRVNDHFEPEQLRVPFSRMVYIGDSETDVPCMTLVNARGGYSIGVYNEETGDKTRVEKLMREKRIGYSVPADYRKGKPLDRLIRMALEEVSLRGKLDRFGHIG